MNGPHVAIVGGGLASLAAATVLSESACQVTIFESRRQLGGRAASFRDSASNELVDFCQHVGMGCCTYLLDFLQRNGLAEYFSRERRLLFVGPNNERCQFEAVDWLPAPLHLLPAFCGLKYLSWAERVQLAWSLVRLAQVKGDARDEVFSTWLARQRQSAHCVDWFWRVVLESALGESLDNVSTAAARQVFVSGFMAHRQAYEVLLPRMPLGELFDGHVASQLIARGIEIHRGTTVQTITTRGQQFNLLIENNSQTFDQVIVAVPWRAIRGVLDNAIQSQLPWISAVEKLPSSPITGIHLWFDRPITNEPHAVLVGRLSQWLFSRGVDTTTIGDQSSHYYQVVISASRMLQQQDRTQIVNQVVTELSSIWPATREARLLRSRVVTEPNAVFARNAQTEGARPHAATPVPGLFVAGDWTNTDWPATMEGAVRSGYFAARTALQSIGEAPSPWSHVPDLPRGKLAQWLCGPQ